MLGSILDVYIYIMYVCWINMDQLYHPKSNYHAKQQMQHIQNISLHSVANALQMLCLGSRVVHSSPEAQDSLPTILSLGAHFPKSCRTLRQTTDVGPGGCGGYIPGLRLEKGTGIRHTPCETSDSSGEITLHTLRGSKLRQLGNLLNFLLSFLDSCDIL